MGYVRIKVRIWNIEDPSKSEELVLLADTGAIYTVLPSSTLKRLGVKPVGKRRFKLADNQVVEREIGLIGIQVEDRFTYTIAVFGDEEAHLLGVTTLEELGLEVDPVKGELRPMELLLTKLAYEEIYRNIPYPGGAVTFTHS